VEQPWREPALLPPPEQVTAARPRAKVPRPSPCSIDATPRLRKTISYQAMHLNRGHETLDPTIWPLRSVFLYDIWRLPQSAVLFVQHRKATRSRCFRPKVDWRLIWSKVARIWICFWKYMKFWFLKCQKFEQISGCRQCCILSVCTLLNKIYCIFSHSKNGKDQGVNTLPLLFNKDKIYICNFC
jgi:hypothetical protein